MEIQTDNHWVVVTIIHNDSMIKKISEGHCHRQWEILKFLSKIIICILEFSNFMVFPILSFCSPKGFFYKRKLYPPKISSGLIIRCSSKSLMSTYILIVLTYLPSENYFFSNLKKC